MIHILDLKSLDILVETSLIRKMKFVYAMFKEQSIVEAYGISSGTFYKFLIETERLYNQKKNPFHNFDHGISGKLLWLVLNGCYNFLKYTTCHLYFMSDISQAALMFAGLMHDIDHLGRNNDFLKNSLHQLSILYNDQSVVYDDSDSWKLSLCYCF